ncbi:Phage-related protein [uncultured Clostridium sp.]|uniref:phage tail spike protein n=1 Tax=uncultured Clostridium sp. TaxID=59620 RepID=UPI000821DE32|nr:phage tail spike protein [uncultured Clostridium sp.]SCJ00279.1 Phage-related protein [uncultured Clostridium sp.]
MSRDVKIALYNGNTPKSKALTSVAGIAVLDNYCTFCKVKEDLSNGNYELDATFIIDHKNIHKEIKEEAILKVKVDYGYEIFRIAKVTLGKKYIDVFARQITIQDQLNTFLSDVRPTEQQGISALRYIVENSNEYKEGKQYARDLEFSSNIETLGTAYYQNMNLYEALFDCDQSFIKRWGGEVQRRGYRTIIDRKIGQDRGFQVREGKNLTGFEALTNIDSVVTRIKPVGYDGITIDGYVQSGLIDKYSTIKTRKIKYDNVKVKKEADEEGFNTLEEAQAELIRLAKLEFTEKHIDEIEATYRINFIDLFKTEEYKDYAMLERVYLGDSVNVYIESLDIDITVRAIAREYNVLTQEFVEIELSNVDLSKLKPISITEIIKEMDNLPDSMQGILEQARKEATDLINAGINGHVVVNKNEILIMDTADKNTATKLWRFNLNGIAHSSTGYNGQFNTAWTMDGKIVLTEATCELINATLIRAGVLSNVNNTVQLDLQSDEGLLFRNKDKNSIRIRNQTISLYDWDGNDIVGNIYTTRANNEKDRLGVVLAHERNTTTSLSYKHSNGNTYPYIKFDNDNIGDDTQTPITIFKETDFEGTQLWFKYGLNSLYTVDSGAFMANVSKSFNIADRTSNKIVFNMSNKNFAFYEDGNAYLFKQANSNDVWCMYNFKVDKNFHVNGNFTVSGTKNCIQETENYGERLFYSVEDCENYLTDRSMEVFNVEVTSSGTFERLILLDNIFKEAVNLDIDYTVEVIKQGWGDYRIKEQTKDYFIVESDRKDFTFKYVITAKRRGFEKKRLEEYKE